jgi:cob(I)alamin adenosyltransferase
VQFFTGDGKGKTTAALGLALRAAGQGNKVLIYQFLKPPYLDTGERNAAKSNIKNIAVEALDASWNISTVATGNDLMAITAVKIATHKALVKLTTMAEEREYDVLILDEIVYCLLRGLAEFDDIRNLIERRDKHVEIILTGRGATPELIALADLVTEMRSIKHPFDNGTAARKGIEY